MNKQTKETKTTIGEGVEFERIRRITGYLVSDCGLTKGTLIPA